MKEIFSKLSLYDMLAMLIPGGTILVFIALSLDFELYFDTSKIAPALAWTVMLILAYLIGIVNHIVTSELWSHFRNNLEMINEVGKVVDGVKGEKSIRFLINCCIEPIIAILLIVLVCLFFYCCKWNDCACWWIFVVPVYYMVMMLISLFKNRRKDSNKKKEDEKEKKEKKLMDAYYRSYYFALKNRYSNDIPIMEGQVAFMQSMIIPLLLLALLPCEVLNDYIPHGAECCVRWLLISLIVLMILAIILRQRKIYERVWEDAKFLKLLQQKNADKNC